MMKKLLQTLNKNLLVIFSAGIVFVMLLGYGYFRAEEKIIDRKFYDTLIEKGFIQKAKIRGEYVVFYSGDTVYKIAKEGVNIKDLANSVPLEVGGDVNFSQIMVEILAITLMLLFIALIIKGQRRKESDQQKPSEQQKPSHNLAGLDDFSSRIFPMVSTVNFNDIAGIKEVKEELEEIIDFLKNPKKYKEFGIKLPKGVLLIGPPGVGKTLIAKAVAGEANVPFFYQSGSAFVQIYVGMGAKRVRELFTRAKAMSPSIIFIDEIDAVGKARGGYRNDEREATLNQLLTEMDGFEESSGVIIIGATNKIDMLDEALLRSGRFDRRIFVGLPAYHERIEIFKVYLKDKPTDVDFDELGRMTVGFSGAAIASLTNEAAIVAVKRGSKKIEVQDFLAVKDKVLLGKRQRLTFTEDEKKVLATYQAAKAIAAYWFEVEFDKISLISDGLRDIDKEIISKTEMYSKLKVYLSGAAATEVIYNENFSNNYEDLMKAKMIATEMVERYGMGNRLLGDISDASTLLQQAYDEMKEFSTRMTHTLKNVETLLIEQETVSKEELQALVQEVL